MLGHIDLDPASCAAANQVVRADRFFSLESDGLAQEWQGRIWMNPPYAAGLLSKFIGKLEYHVSRKDVTEAIVLVNNATETGWFCTLAGMSTAIVFPKRRIQFITPQGSKKGSPIQGQAFAYIGGRADRFLEVVSPFGWRMTITKRCQGAAQDAALTS